MEKKRRRFDHETAVPDPMVFKEKMEGLNRTIVSMGDAARILGLRYGIASYKYLVHGKVSTKDAALFGDRYLFFLTNTLGGGWDIYWGFMPNRWNDIPNTENLWKVARSAAEIKILFLDHAEAFWAGYLAHVKSKDRDMGKALSATKSVLGELGKLIKASVWKPVEKNESADPPQDSPRIKKVPKDTD